MQGVKVENGKEIFMRLTAYVLRRYKWHLLAVMISIVISVLANVQGTLFIRTLIDDYITPMVKSGSRDFGPLTRAIARVAVFYLIGILGTFIYNRVMINVSQGTMLRLRTDLFTHMEKLPVS